MINHHEVSWDEFKWFMEQERAGVLAHFKAKYGLENGTNYWQHQAGGTTPRATLKKRTVERIVREKVEQILFQELGLIEDTSYVGFLRALEKTNLERAEAHRNGKVIYGPVSYSQLQFFGHWKASLQVQAKELLAARRSGASQEKLRAFYVQNRALFKTAGTWTLEIVSLRRNEASGTERKTEGFEGAAREIARRMKLGEDAEKVAAGYAAKRDILVTRSRLELLTEDRMSELFPEEAVLKHALALVPGESMVIPASASGAQVVHCVARDPGGDAPYERVEQSIRSKYLDREYDRLLEDEAARAKVRTNDAVMDGLLP